MKPSLIIKHIEWHDVDDVDFRGEYYHIDLSVIERQSDGTEITLFNTQYGDQYHDKGREKLSAAIEVLTHIYLNTHSIEVLSYKKNLPDDEQFEELPKNKFYLNSGLPGVSENCKIVFDMPSFCSGNYEAIIYKDSQGYYIDRDNNFFDGCRDFEICPI